MPDCKACKENREIISRHAHEADMDRMERVNKRVFWAWIITLVLFAASWAGFIWYESQWEVVETHQEVVQEANGDGTNNFVGGNYYGEANSEDADEETSTQNWRK